MNQFALIEEYFSQPRSISAPAILDSNLLFAFPNEYVYVFSDKIRSGSETLSRSTHEYSSSYPLEREDKLSSDDNSTTDSLVNRVVDKCMTEDDLEVSTFEPVPFYPECSFGFFMPGETFQQIYLMAKDQVGCRLLQKKLEEKDLLGVSTVFSQTVQHFPDLMIDPFGNYLCQKLLEVVDSAQLGMVIEIVSPTIVDISLNAHGTRSVQKLIEVSCKTPFIGKIENALKNSVVILAQDLNGNHVIQKCLNVLEPPNDQFIYEIASKSVVEIATHRHGCCVLQRCIDAAKGKQKLSLVQCIVDHAVVLIQDAYGNYVVQYVLDLQLPEVNGRLAQIFCQQLVDLSKQKFSSNVIEKCLQLNEQDVQEYMIKEIMKHVPQMLMDQYANYVQRALTLASLPLYSDLLKAIKPQMDALRKTHFGKRIYTKLGKKYPNLVEARYCNF